MDFLHVDSPLGEGVSGWGGGGAGGRGGMWEEVVGASLWISEDFLWIWVDFLHMDPHLYLYYLQSIYRRPALIAKVGFFFPKMYALVC